MGKVDIDGTMTNSPGRTQFRILTEILMERERQDQRWGSQPTIDHARWLAIMTEELGEAAAAWLKETAEMDSPERPAPTMSSRDELVQLTAVVLRALEAWT